MESPQKLFNDFYCFLMLTHTIPINDLLLKTFAFFICNTFEEKINILRNVAVRCLPNCEAIVTMLTMVVKKDIYINGSIIINGFWHYIFELI